MLVNVAAVMGIARRAQRFVEGSFDVAIINVLHHATEVLVLPVRWWCIFLVHAEKHNSRFLVGLRRVKSHPDAANHAGYLVYVDINQNAGLTNAIMELAHLVVQFVERNSLVAIVVNKDAMVLHLLQTQNLH